MNPIVESLYRDGNPDAEAVYQFIQQNQFPLVEPGRVTFVYRGQAQAVHLRSWISGLDTAQPLVPLEASDLWALTMELPDKSRFEYKFEVEANGVKQLVLDDLNGVLAHDPFGANSVCQGYGYERPGWTLHDPTARSGSLDRLEIASRSFRDTREVQIYLPAQFRRNRTYPLLIVHDGLDYLRYADLKNVLDNLIHAGEVAPLVVFDDPVEAPGPASIPAVVGKEVQLAHGQRVHRLRIALEGRPETRCRPPGLRLS